MSNIPVANLSELVEQRTDKIVTGKDPNLPYIGLEHIAQGSPVLLATASSQVSTSVNSIFESGDILFGKLRPNLKKSIQVDFGGYCSTDIIVFRTLPETSPKFAAKILQWDAVFDEAVRTSEGTKMPRTSWERLRDFPIFLPPLPEQRRIAAILDTADDAIRHTGRVIAKLKQVKAGLLHDLLTRGLDAHGHLRDPLAHSEQFKDSPLGRIPREWEVKRIGEISNVTKLAGFEFTNVMKYRDDGEIIALRALNIKNEELDLTDIQRISRDVSDSLPRSKIHSGDILITYIGAYIGDVLLINESNKYHLAPNIAKITAQNRVLPEFLQWVLRSEHMKSQIGQYTTVTATPSLTMTQIRGIKVVVPQNIDEQSKITSIIAAHDSRIRAEEVVLAKLRQQKQGLMADLLTGRVRVKDEG